MPRLAILCGLADERAILAGSPHHVFCGAAARDALSALVPGDCQALLSFGVCGGLVPKVGFGDVLIAASVRTRTGLIQASDAWAGRLKRALPGARLAPFWSDPQDSAATAAERQTLAQRTGAWVADQETAAVAQLAAARKIPWIALRSPSDIWSQSLSPDADHVTAADGTPEIGSVVADVLRDPAELPGFIQDADGYARALTALLTAYRAVRPDFAFAT